MVDYVFCLVKLLKWRIINLWYKSQHSDTNFHLSVQPDSEEVRDDRHTAMNLLKRRKQLHSSGLSPTRNRYAVADSIDRT